MLRTLRHSALIAACTAAPLAAQFEDDQRVYPVELTSLEGDSQNATLLNSPYMRWQQIAGHSFGAGREHLVKWINLRRDGLATSTNAGPRSIEMQIDLGAGIRSTFSNNFAANWIPTTQITVFNKKTVMLPDWSSVPASTPAPLDLQMQCDFIYNHTGFIWLLTEFQVWNATTGGDHVLDMALADGTSTSVNSPIGTGCTTATGLFTSASSVDVSNFGMNYAMTFGATGAPPSAGVSFWLDGFATPVPLTGLCQPIQVLPSIDIGPIPADPAGNVSATFPLGAYPSTLWNAPLYVQAIALDFTQTSGLPIAVSNGEQMLMPYEPFDMIYTSATSESATTGDGPTEAGLVMLLADTPPIITP